MWDFQFSHKSPLISRHFIIYKKTFPSLCAPGVKTLVGLPDSHIQPYASNVARPVKGGGISSTPLLYPHKLIMDVELACGVRMAGDG